MTIILPFFSDEQLDALLRKKDWTLEDQVRLIVTVRAAWRALDRLNIEIQQEQRDLKTSMQCSLALVRNMCQEVFNIKIPPEAGRLT